MQAHFTLVFDLNDARSNRELPYLFSEFAWELGEAMKLEERIYELSGSRG